MKLVVQNASGTQALTLPGGGGKKEFLKDATCLVCTRIYKKKEKEKLKVQTPHRSSADAGGTG